MIAAFDNPGINPIEDREWWLQPTLSSQLRRAHDHDYKAPCVYMITMNKNSSVPLLSSLCGDPTVIGSVCVADINGYGEMVSDAIVAFCNRNHAIRIRYFVIMPDHVHFIVYVTEYLPQHLAIYLSYLKSDCSKRFWALHPEMKAKGKDGAFFVEGLNDRILWRRGQWVRWELYIRDNPRRALLRKMYPDYYRRAIIVAHNGEWHHTYGNVCIISFPEMAVVRYTRRRTPEENDVMLENCRLIAQEGGVLVSPFIHPREKELLVEAVARGWKIIRIIEDPIMERKHPSKMMHEYCASGNLLLVALRQQGERKDANESQRSIFMKMNALAERIERESWRY